MHNPHCPTVQEESFCPNTVNNITPYSETGCYYTQPLAPLTWSVMGPKFMPQK